MSAQLVRPIQITYPPEFQAAVAPLWAAIDAAKAEIEQITGLNDPALTASAMIDYDAQTRKVENLRAEIREYQQMIARTMGRFMPQYIVPGQSQA